MHDEVSVHFFRKAKISLDRVSDGDDDDKDDSVEEDAVLQVIAGHGDGSVMGWPKYFRT